MTVKGNQITVSFKDKVEFGRLIFIDYYIQRFEKSFWKKTEKDVGKPFLRSSALAQLNSFISNYKGLYFEDINGIIFNFDDIGVEMVRSEIVDIEVKRLEIIDNYL